jgi:hypothetical protein
MSIAFGFSSYRTIAAPTWVVVLWSVVACLSTPIHGQSQLPADRGTSTTQPLDEKAATQIISGASVEQPRAALELSPDAIDDILNGVNDDATAGMAGAALYSRFQAIDRINKAHAKWRKDAAAKGLMFLTTLQPKNVSANFEIGNDSAAADAKANRLAAAAKIRNEQKQGVKYDFADELHISYYYAPLVDTDFWGPSSHRPAFGWRTIPIASLVSGPVRIDYDLAGSFVAFRTGVGAESNNNGVSFRVLLDGKEAWRCDGPVDIRQQKACLLDVRGVKALTLVVHQAGSSPTNSLAQTVAWTNPVLFRRMPGKSDSGAMQVSKPTHATSSTSQPVKNPAEVQAIENRIAEAQAKLEASTTGPDAVSFTSRTTCTPKRLSSEVVTNSSTALGLPIASSTT